MKPLYCGHIGNLETVLSIEVSLFQRLNTEEPPIVDT